MSKYEYYRSTDVASINEVARTIPMRRNTLLGAKIRFPMAALFDDVGALFPEDDALDEGTVDADWPVGVGNEREVLLDARLQN